MAQNFFQQQQAFNQSFQEQQEAIGNNTAEKIDEERENMAAIKENSKELTAQMAMEKFQGGIEALSGAGMEIGAGFTTLSKGLNLGKQIYGLAQTPGAFTQALQKTYPTISNVLSGELPENVEAAVQAAKTGFVGQSKMAIDEAQARIPGPLNDMVGKSKRAIIPDTDQIRLSSKAAMGNISDDAKRSALKEHTEANWEANNLGEKSPENVDIINRTIDGAAGDELNRLTNKAVMQQDRPGFTQTDGIQDIRSEVSDILSKPPMEISAWNANSPQYVEMSEMSGIAPKASNVIPQTPAPAPTEIAPEAVGAEKLTSVNAPGLIAPEASGEASLAGDVAGTATKAGAEAGVEGAVEGGLASTLEVPGLGEIAAAGLGIFSLVEGLKDLFDKPKSAPPPPPLASIQQQATITSDVQPGI